MSDGVMRAWRGLGLVLTGVLWAGCAAGCAGPDQTGEADQQVVEPAPAEAATTGAPAMQMRGGRAAVGAVEPAFRRTGLQPIGSIFAPLDLPTPTERRLGSGAPGPGYWHQRVDYEIDARLDPEAETVTASVRVVYHNNSPHELTYVWMQLEQNLFRNESIGTLQRTPGSVMAMLWEDFNGGFDVTNLRTASGAEMALTEYDTLGRFDPPEPIGPGETFVFKFDYVFTVPPALRRMGSEKVERGKIFELAQWFPHVCNYDDVSGWNTLPYLGSGEFYTNFGSYKVNLTVPATYIVTATGTLQNPRDVLSVTQWRRLQQAMRSDEPVRIIGPGDVGRANMRPTRDGELTWRFAAEDVRTFAWAASDAFMWDAAVARITDLDGTERTVLCQSFYPHEAEAWDPDHPGKGSTRSIKHAIEFYSKFWHPYPYPVMSNINGPEGGMEYPMIIFCGGRMNAEAMFGVTDHEVGHNWFPMLVNTNERNYMWFDEGFNSFGGIYSGAAWHGRDPDVSRHIGQTLDVMTAENPQPIVTHPDKHWPGWTGALNYRKTALGLYILREKVLGYERFDTAFREYIRRWAFKHPQPADFFRTMEDAAGVDLAWFWRGWFYEAADFDQAVSGVFHDDDRTTIVLDNNGRMVMPVEMRVTYNDGSQENIALPVEIWSTTDRWRASIRNGGRTVTKVELDPRGLLPDTDPENNTWSGE
jgi:hypothetical protein